MLGIQILKTVFSLSARPTQENTGWVWRRFFTSSARRTLASSFTWLWFPTTMSPRTRPTMTSTWTARRSSSEFTWADTQAVLVTECWRFRALFKGLRLVFGGDFHLRTRSFWSRPVTTQLHCNYTIIPDNNPTAAWKEQEKSESHKVNYTSSRKSHIACFPTKYIYISIRWYWLISVL